MKITLIISVFTGIFSFPFNEEMKKSETIEDMINADDTGNEIFNPDGHDYHEFQTYIKVRWNRYRDTYINHNMMKTITLD